jgi:hypothetical protein
VVRVFFFGYDARGHSGRVRVTMTTCAAPDARTVTNDRQRVTGLLVLHMQRHPFVYPPRGALVERTFYSLRFEADSVLALSSVFLRRFRVHYRTEG